MNVRAFATILTLTATLLASRVSLATDAGYSIVVVRVGASAASTYTGTRTDREWVRQWKSEGPRSVRNVKLRQATGESYAVETTYYGCTLDSEELARATLTMTCGSFSIEKK